MATGQQHELTRYFSQGLGGFGLRLLSASWAAGGWAIGGWAIVSLVTTTVSRAQQVPLPPPPTVSVPGLTNPPALINSTPAPNSETVFLAPINRQDASSQYTVYVNGDSPYLLQQVRTVEPAASIQRYQGQAIIQAGTFDNEISARRQVAVLNAQGMIAEMTMGNAEMAAASPSATTTSRYLVVVPGGREELPTLAERAIRMGIRQEAIQEKNAPLGPHLEIGPFAQHSDAKKISQFLNGGGFDSRVYYSR
ncbi:MAG: hypothetical protein RBJ76_09855 [Stenomitos frigidus ULC029]